MTAGTLISVTSLVPGDHLTFYIGWNDIFDWHSFKIDLPSSLICLDAPYGVIPAWLAPLLVPYCRPIMDCPALRTPSSKFLLFSLATLTPRAGPSQDFFWAWKHSLEWKYGARCFAVTDKMLYLNSDWRIKGCCTILYLSFQNDLSILTLNFWNPPKFQKWIKFNI